MDSKFRYDWMLFNFDIFLQKRKKLTIHYNQFGIKYVAQLTNLEMRLCCCKWTVFVDTGGDCVIHSIQLPLGNGFMDTMGAESSYSSQNASVSKSGIAVMLKATIVFFIYFSLQQIFILYLECVMWVQLRRPIQC